MRRLLRYLLTFPILTLAACSGCKSPPPGLDMARPADMAEPADLAVPQDAAADAPPAREDGHDCGVFCIELPDGGVGCPPSFPGSVCINDCCVRGS